MTGLAINSIITQDDSDLDYCEICGEVMIFNKCRNGCNTKRMFNGKIYRKIIKIITIRN